MDIQPPNTGSRTPKPAEEVLNSVILDLENLRQNVTSQLSQDLQRLRSEKQQLTLDVEKLRKQYQQLQSQQLESLSQRQIAQHQLWLKELAHVLANNLQEELTHKLNLQEGKSKQQGLGAVPSGELPMTNPSTISEEESTDRFKESLDETLSRTFEAVQQDLSSYQSDLSQQLSNMRSMEQQGEAILEALVSRLRQELQETTIEAAGDRSLPTTTTQEPPPAVRAHPQPPAAPAAPVAKPASQVQVGLLLALASATVLSLFNVSLKVVLKGGEPKMVLDTWEAAGVITPGFGNSILILFLRMIVVMAIMPFLAAFLYPAVGNDLTRSLKSKDLPLWSKVLGSAFFLFASQILIYIALGNIAAGVAVTIFFIYPIVTVLGSWGLFGDRPSIVRFGAMGGITLGLILAGYPSLSLEAFGDPVLGTLSALAAGVTFAGYVLLTQMAAGKLHPIPFSLVNFFAILVFSGVSLILLGLGLLPSYFGVSYTALGPQDLIALIISGGVLGVLTLFSYLLNNFAIRFAGAALASVIGTLGPALTALFAWIVVGETLQLIQIGGMMVVILSVAAISLERMFAAKKKVS